MVATKNRTHGMTDESRGSTYITWKSMRKRCNNRNDPKYASYGALGVKVCPEWDDFECFVREMGHRPKNMSIDRINNALGYSKANCRWATPREQRMNQRRMLKSNQG